MEKYIIICIAGQSNAVGYDESAVTLENLYCADSNRIKQLGFFGEDNLKVIPLDYCAQSMQKMKIHNRSQETHPGTKGIHLPLANLMLPYLPEDYGILILPVAFGGTGFTVGEDVPYDEVRKKPAVEDDFGQCGPFRWGDNTAYYRTLRDRIKYALDLNTDNLFGGILWCQGEHDNLNAKDQIAGFGEMTDHLFREMNEMGYGTRVPKGVWDKELWYNMETVSYWYTQGECSLIWENYRKWNPHTYIEVPRTTPSNAVNGTGATAMIREAHFGNNSYSEIIAPLVLEKFLSNNMFQFL